MKSIIVCGYNHYHYLDSVIRGFDRNHLRTYLITHPNVGLDKIHHRGLTTRLKAKIRIDVINRRLLRSVQTNAPDIVLIINGESVKLSTLLEIRKQACLVLWIVDSITNLRISADHMNAYPYIFLFEPNDIETVQNAYYLPYGFDEAYYHPLKLPVSYDVVFVGSPHTNRLPILESVARYCHIKGFRFGVFGPGYFPRFPKINRLHKTYPNLSRAVIRNGRLSPCEINHIYNESHIVINIHDLQSRAGINPRTFEIAASGRFQLVDYHSRMADFFVPDSEIVTYNNTDDLLHRIQYYIDNAVEREDIASKAYHRALSCHRFEQRCQKIIEVIRGKGAV